MSVKQRGNTAAVTIYRHLLSNFLKDGEPRQSVGDSPRGPGAATATARPKPTDGKKRRSSLLQALSEPQTSDKLAQRPSKSKRPRPNANPFTVERQQGKQAGVTSTSLANPPLRTIQAASPTHGSGSSSADTFPSASFVDQPQLPAQQRRQHNSNQQQHQQPQPQHQPHHPQPHHPPQEQQPQQQQHPHHHHHLPQQEAQHHPRQAAHQPSQAQQLPSPPTQHLGSPILNPAELAAAYAQDHAGVPDNVRALRRHQLQQMLLRGHFPYQHSTHRPPPAAYPASSTAPPTQRAGAPPAAPTPSPPALGHPTHPPASRPTAIRSSFTITPPLTSNTSPPPPPATAAPATSQPGKVCLPVGLETLTARAAAAHRSGTRLPWQYFAARPAPARTYQAPVALTQHLWPPASALASPPASIYQAKLTHSPEGVLAQGQDCGVDHDSRPQSQQALRLLHHLEQQQQEHRQHHRQHHPQHHHQHHPQHHHPQQHLHQHLLQQHHQHHHQLQVPREQCQPPVPHHHHHHHSQRQTPMQRQSAKPQWSPSPSIHDPISYPAAWHSAQLPAPTTTHTPPYSDPMPPATTPPASAPAVVPPRQWPATSTASASLPLADASSTPWGQLEAPAPLPLARATSSRPASALAHLPAASADVPQCSSSMDRWLPGGKPPPLSLSLVDQVSQPDVGWPSQANPLLPNTARPTGSGGQPPAHQQHQQLLDLGDSEAEPWANWSGSDCGRGAVGFGDGQVDAQGARAGGKGRGAGSSGGSGISGVMQFGAGQTSAAASAGMAADALLFDHFEDGRGDWDSDMIGLDLDAVGWTGTGWEGLGSSSLF